MLAKSKLSRAPRSDRSSWARSRASRSARSRARSTRSSQSTAFGPKVGMAIVSVPSRFGWRATDVAGRATGTARRATEVQRPDLRMVEHFAAGTGEPDPAVLQHHPVTGQPQAGPGVLLDQEHGLARLVHHR